MEQEGIPNEVVSELEDLLRRLVAPTALGEAPREALTALVRELQNLREHLESESSLLFESRKTFITSLSRTAKKIDDDLSSEIAAFRMISSGYGKTLADGNNRLESSVVTRINGAESSIVDGLDGLAKAINTLKVGLAKAINTLEKETSAAHSKAGKQLQDVSTSLAKEIQGVRGRVAVVENERLPAIQRKMRIWFWIVAITAFLGLGVGIADLVIGLLSGAK